MRQKNRKNAKYSSPSVEPPPTALAERRRWVQECIARIEPRLRRRLAAKLRAKAQGPYDMDDVLASARRRVDEAVHDVTDEERAVLELAARGVPHELIAEQAGVSQWCHRSRWRRLVARLRRIHIRGGRSLVGVTRGGMAA